MPEKSMESLWIISGESSGDVYGAALVREFRRLAPTLHICAMGGEAMRTAGADIRVDATELGVMGGVEVLRKLPFFLTLLGKVSKEIIADAPRAVIMIDYPGFNLRLAQRLHKAGISVFWYVSPQVWAWKKGRIPKLAACLRKMYCIFPFEPAVYEGSGLPVEFPGHPLLEILEPLRTQPEKRDPNLVILLPGSRSGELKRLLPLIFDSALKLKESRPALRFAMPLQREASLRQVREALRSYPHREEMEACLELSVGDAREKMRDGCAGLAASGTVTVEAALLGLPLVVIYKINPITWFLAKRIVHLKYVTILNLVMDEPVFRECLQDQATVENVVPEMEAILPDGDRYKEVREKMMCFAEQLGGKARVAERIARDVLELTQ